MCKGTWHVSVYNSGDTTASTGIQLTSTMFSRMYGNEVEGVSIKAGKTGYTDQAHNCLVNYAEKDGKEYITVMAAGKQVVCYI